ncbi:NAD-dependent epimerase/dehydratase family protein [Marinoscillum sp. MHG1-6]|uniref:NAD-dependent epimerase/dehydratase family protein n=1 Tax=Marinoscillum sp. MHG1-6 TaxID=2959627 RepID=UPI002157DC99|nr:NAD-dependent epimerase/dehydratase family protein [Marinoscillum sp. MHG1-6]
MKAIITGATGMVGMGVLLECLDHPEITQVLTIGRSKVNLGHPKLKQVEHMDFSDFSTIKDQLAGYDAAYLCMGISAAGLNEAQYTKITYDYTLALAKELVALNPQMTCIYVSGEGTDSSEKGRIMWARVKGKTENDIINLDFKQAFAFRPGAILPLRGIKSKTKLYQTMYDYLSWLLRLIKKVSPNSVVNTTEIGLSMINLTLKGYDKKVIRPKDILITAKG